MPISNNDARPTITTETTGERLPHARRNEFNHVAYYYGVPQVGDPHPTMPNFRVSQVETSSPVIGPQIITTYTLNSSALNNMQTRTQLEPEPIVTVSTPINDPFGYNSNSHMQTTPPMPPTSLSNDKTTMQYVRDLSSWFRRYPGQVTGKWIRFNGEIGTFDNHNWHPESTRTLTNYEAEILGIGMSFGCHYIPLPEEPVKKTHKDTTRKFNKLDLHEENQWNT